MTFCKVLDDGNIISVGCTFLKWNVKRHKFSICDSNEAQFLQSFDEKEVFRAKWMKPFPSEAGEYEEFEIVVIPQQEYEDLQLLLSEGENVYEDDIEEEVPEDKKIVEEPEEEEKPLSLAEMRAIIKKQQEQIERLMKKTKLK